MNSTHTQELRFKRGHIILGYISKFSATERVLFGILIIAALISSLALAYQASSLFMSHVPAHGGTLREGQIGLPRTINPVLAVSDIDKDLSALVYSGLTRYYKGSYIPDIASGWTVSDDGLTYTFTLRKDVHFHDKTLLTADDVVFTIQKIQNPLLKSPRLADWIDVEAKIVDTYTVEFKLKQPYAGFIANTSVGIIPKHIWSNVSDEQFLFSQFNTEPVGTGPYAVGSIVRDAGGIPITYELEVAGTYYNKAPYISAIHFYFYPSIDKATSALNSGYIDSIPSIDAHLAQTLATNTAESYTITETDLSRLFGVFYNQNQSAVLADPVVRQALDLATDRTAIIDTILSGYGVPAYSPIPDQTFTQLGVKSTATHNPGASVERAIKLLEQNGWKRNADGVYEKKAKGKTASTTLAFDIYTGDAPDLVATAKMLKGQWALIGAHVDVQIFEASDLYQNVIRSRKYDALLFGQQIGKDRDLYAFWHSSQRNAPGLNVAMYTNSKADTLLSDIRTTASTTVAATYYEKLDKIMSDDMPALFLYTPDFIYAVPKSLSGMDLSTLMYPADRWSSIADWYTETETVWNIFNK